MPSFLPHLPEFFPQKIQDLEPKLARLCLGIKSFIADTLEVVLEEKRVLVAFSGGADSLALLIILHLLGKSMGFKVFAFHLDHVLRPSSEAEALWCKALCEKLEVELSMERVDIKALQASSRQNLEELARKVRYARLLVCAEQHKCEWICTGHQLNDLAEDVLLRLLRGVGWPSLGGMVGVDRERKLLRPLLLTSRESLEDFLTSLGIPWITDESNFSHEYLRNRVRHKIFPLFIEENPNFLQSVAHLWQLGRVDEAFFEKELTSLQLEGSGLQPKSAKQKNEGQLPVGEGQLASGEGQLLSDKAKFVLEQSKVQGLDRALRLRVYKKILAKIGGGYPQLANIFALDRAWQGKQFPKKIEFNGCKFAIVGKGRIEWFGEE